MAGGTTRRDLFLQVSGSVSPLRQVLQVGKTSLVEFAGDAAKQLEAVEKSLRDLGGANAAENAKRITDSYAAAFKDIRRNAQEVLSAPNGAGAVSIINASSARQAAEAAAMQASALREVAAAAKAAALEQGADNSQLVQYAAAAAVAARNADDHAIQLREQATALGLVEGKLAGHVVATRKASEISGQARAGYQQLSYQLGDVATQFASGTPPAIIFAQQIGQVTQALGLVAGEAKGFIGFLGGPWGMAISAALVMLTPFVGKLFEGADGSAEMAKKGLTLVDALSKEKFGTEAALKALKDYNDEKDRARKKDEEATKATLISARARLQDALATRDQIKAELDRQRALSGQMLSTNGMNANPAQAAAAAVLADQEVLVAETRKALNNLSIDFATRNAVDLKDKTAIATRYYDGLRAEALAAAEAEKKAGKDVDRALLQNKLSAIETEKQAKLKQIRDTEAAEKKAARDAKREAPTGSSSSALLSSAAQYKGASENTAGGREILQNLFKQAGVAIDPKMTAWCAAFVNAVLATNGLPGTGSLQAKSFLNYGTKTDAPQKGDIVVLNRDGGGHVGFFEGFDKKGNVKVLGGNQGDKVGINTFNRADVLGYRRAPSSAQDAQGDADRVRDKEAQRQAAFEGQLARAQDDYLAAMAALADGAEETAQAQYARLRAETIAREEAIDREVAAGKLTEAEGEQLKVLNEGIYAGKKTLIERNAQSKLVRDQNAAEMRKLDDAIAMLDLQGELATTAKDRRRIGRLLLQAEERKLEQTLEDIRRDPNATPKQLSEAQAALDQFRREKPLRTEINDQRDADSMQSWFQGLEDSVGTADAVKETLESITVQGLDRGVDALGNMVAGALKLKGIAGEIVAEFAKMLIKKAALEIGTKLFKLKDGAVPGFADGIIRGPGTGTSDDIPGWMAGVGPIFVSNGESIMTAAATRTYGPALKAMNRGSFPKIPGFATGFVGQLPRLPNVSALSSQLLSRGGGGAVEVRGKIKVEAGPMFDARMEEVSARTVGAAAEPIMAGAENRTFRRLSRPNLPGGYGG